LAQLRFAAPPEPVLGQAPGIVPTKFAEALVADPKLEAAQVGFVTMGTMGRMDGVDRRCMGERGASKVSIRMAGGDSTCALHDLTVLSACAHPPAHVRLRQLR
jgi:hypothetical protein